MTLGLKDEHASEKAKEDFPVWSITLTHLQYFVTMPSFKLQFSLDFVTSCYVIFSLSMVQAMDMFMII